MKIKVKPGSDYLDGRYRFAADGQYDVPDRRGGVHVSNGWADELPDDAPGEFIIVTMADLVPDAPRASQDGATLEVQDLTLGNSATTVGG